MDNCYVLFSVENPKFNCTNPILYKKEKEKIQSSSKLNQKISINTVFWYLSHVDKNTMNGPQNFLLVNINLVYEIVYGF